MTKALPALLDAWREAERLWERSASTEQVQAAALAVVKAWTDYQNAVPPPAGEFMLVANDEGRYVAATDGVTGVLGYAPAELIGRRIVDITAQAIADATPQEWARFLAAGRQDGFYQLRHAGGGVVEVRYRARAHHPIPGYHVSVLSRRDSTQPG